MEKSFWLDRWARNDIGFHMDRPHHDLVRFFGELRVNPGDPVFVPLCGKSPDLAWLRERGAHVVGVELSPIAVAGFFADHEIDFRIGLSDRLQHYTAPGFDLYCGDLFALQPPQLLGASAAYDRGGLVALPGRMRSQYAAKLAELLGRGCRVLLISYDYDQQEIDGPPFAVPLTEVERLFGDAFTIRELARSDVLWSHRLLVERGVTRLDEMAVLMQRR